MNRSVKLISSFVDNGIGGNPAGVVLEADGMTETDMQRLASIAGYPETAFVSHSDVATVKLDFFTPTKRIPHCGHATVAAFSVLAQQGKVAQGRHSKETVDGLRNIRIEGDKAYLEQIRRHVTPLTAEQQEAAAHALGLEAEQLNALAAPHVVNVGVSFLVIALHTMDDLRRIKPDMQRIAALSETLDLIGFYVISPETEVSERTISARMFAPYYGIEEESATGMGAGCASVYLYEVLGQRSEHYLIEQGRLMTPRSPSLIEAELEITDGLPHRLWIGGVAKIMEG
ncbi:PhzF family phenazine biosynthesis isomerase [Hahella sp. KA22]|uniref:PhzF family phenazine biosynthesis protein n=1 Tax=Hahella sp. KA22 TaxID=1628392 RepID=UPI000FDF4CD5|nr:PhzF family phenazine biosynthesis protein [Hahella sp. KA22]AZZ94082.1 PhzF family phenazine biosynthesis protein [Hahella sp. KA22]QAY57456.1 PhzF family phenazine biosynthesis isomerase [Hahella sp. KA22]